MTTSVISEVLARNGLDGYTTAEAYLTMRLTLRGVLLVVAKLLKDADLEDQHERIANHDTESGIAQEMRADARAILAEVLR